MSDPHAEPSWKTSVRPGGLGWRTFHVVAVALATAAGLFLLWRASGSLFLVFAGLLFAVFLDACTQGLGWIWGVSRAWRLAVVCVCLLVLGVVGVSFGGYTIALQADELFATVQRQLNALRREVRGSSSAPGASSLAPQGEAPPPGQQQQPPSAPAQPWRPAPGQPSQEPGDGGGLGAVVRSFFPNAAALLQSATAALGGVAGVLGNLVVIVFLGLYVAVDPSIYRRGALLLVPPDKRERAGSVLDESATALRWWVIGQLVSMGIIAALTYVALLLVGMPAALVLALITGLFAFIPYIGSFVAGAMIVLFGLAQGPTMAFWGLGVYLLVQLVESYVLAPVVQRWSVNISPAVIIGGLTVLGGVFGIWGFILAAPLLAVLRIMVLRLWVEDALGDAEGAKAALGSPGAATDY
jgi:predicted PurR-regulated permease PerM